MSPLLLLALASGSDAATMVATARERLQSPRCVYDSSSTDITVCGLRHADRYRVPFVTHAAGDPRHEPVPAERQRLLARTNPIKELSPFLVGGGMVGVSTTIGGDGKVTAAGLRPLAP